jgi:antitoxin component HigA of HigAB toxin-antitoxin module
MAAPEEINALRRLMESINRMSSSNSASVGKLTTEQQVLKQQLELTKHVAERALQMANDLVSRVSALEMRLPK